MDSLLRERAVAFVLSSLKGIARDYTELLLCHQWKWLLSCREASLVEDAERLENTVSRAARYLSWLDLVGVELDPRAGILDPFDDSLQEAFFEGLSPVEAAKGWMLTTQRADL